MAIFYIDPKSGDDANNGLTPQAPKKIYQAIACRGGDTLLFKRGSLYRDVLHMHHGEENAPITYGAYGEGDAPTFCGSVDLSDPSCWMPTEQKNVWQCTTSLDTDVGNFIFNAGECTATLRWNKEELAAQGDFFDSRCGECTKNGGKPVSEQEVLLYSVGNPAMVYTHIEAAVFGKRCLGTLQSNTILQDLRFINGGVHGLVGRGDLQNISIRRCSFEAIGGCGWSREQRIRFGNGIEFWAGAVENILIEECAFHNIYDSCATQQGPDHVTPAAKRFHVRNNRFDTYSMAAFEYRAQMMIDSSFTGNLCKNAGCGFGMLGEDLPRRSEIWPQPMGHHIFLWRVWAPPADGSLRIANNTFVHAPHGAAIYSIMCPEAEAQVSFFGNSYEGDYLMQAFYGGCATTLP